MRPDRQAQRQKDPPGKVAETRLQKGAAGRSPGRLRKSGRLRKIGWCERGLAQTPGRPLLPVGCGAARQLQTDSLGDHPEDDVAKGQDGGDDRQEEQRHQQPYGFLTRRSRQTGRTPLADAGPGAQRHPGVKVKIREETVRHGLKFRRLTLSLGPPLSGQLSDQASGRPHTPQASRI